MEKLPVAKHLNDDDYKLLLTVYSDHNSSMSSSERVNYTASHIVKVEKNIGENCLNVHYENGDWWKYHPDRTWS